MSHETIEFEVDDRVAVVRLNRPERMNAWNDTLGRELARRRPPMGLDIRPHTRTSSENAA